MRKNQRTWTIIDHLCRSCGGRILQCASGGGPTGGGNPIFKCASCGESTSGITPNGICWCGFAHRGQGIGGHFRCLPFSYLEEHPDLRQAFLACGCDPDREAEVGMITEESFRKYHEKKGAQE